MKKKHGNLENNVMFTVKKNRCFVKTNESRQRRQKKTRKETNNFFLLLNKQTIFPLKQTKIKAKAQYTVGNAP